MRFAPTAAAPIVQAHNIAVVASAVDDAAPLGNGNGRLEALESARVSFTLENRGVTDIDGPTATATSPVEGLVFSADAVPPALAAGASAVFEFVVGIPPDLGDAATAPVMIQLQAGQETWSVPAVV